MADVKYLRWNANPLNWNNTNTPAFTNMTCDANNDGMAFGFQARDTNAITHVGFRYGLRAVTPPTYKVTIEGLTTGSMPDGTDVGGGSPTATNFTPPADTTWDGTWQWIALTNSFTPTLGQRLCVTIRYSTGTVDGTNYSTFTRALASVEAGTVKLHPGSYTLTAGTWASAGGLAIGAVRTASTRYGVPAETVYATRTASTVGHRQAMRFSVPAAMGDTFKVRGVRFTGSMASAAAKAPILGIWSASTAMNTLTIDSDDVGGSSSARTTEYYFDDAATLTCGTVYYAGLEVADAVNGGVSIHGIDLDSADDGDAYPGGASDWVLSNYNGSAWTDAPTVRPFMELILDDITEPSGGGGGGPLIGGRLVR